MSGQPFYVYEHWRPDKDECFYVGKGRDSRAYIFNRTYNRRYNLVVKKLARLGLCVEVRIVKGGLSEPESFVLEQDRIAFWKSVGIGIANKTDGGEGASGRRVEQSTRDKMRAAMIGKTLSEQTKEKIRIANLGKTHSVETRAKMSASRIGNKNGAGGRGLKRSAETIARMSAAQRGRPKSAETRKKISEALLRRSRESVR